MMNGCSVIMKQTCVLESLCCQGDQNVPYHSHHHRLRRQEECERDPQEEIPDLSKVSDRSIASTSSQSLYDLEENCGFMTCDSPVGVVVTKSAATTITNHNEQPIPRDTKVHWGTVQVKLFPIIPGDHPDCVHGPPLTLNWDPIQEFNATIDDYEVERAPNRYYGEQLRLSWFDRRARLKSCGFGQQELLAAEHQAKVVRRHREHTERILVTKEHLKIFPQLMAQRINHALHWKKHRIAVH